MLLPKAVMTSVVSIAWLYTQSLWTGPVGIDLPMAVFPARVGHPVSRNANVPLVRIRLVKEVRAGSVAAVRLAAGSTDAVTIDVKRSALSEQVLAAAFSVRSSLVDRRATHPIANIVVYIPENLGPRPLSPGDQLRFAGLVTELRAQPPDGFLEVSAG